MEKIPFHWIVVAVLLLASLVFGWQAWIAYHTTAIVVEWSTATELDTAGFNLYRSEQPGGVMVKVNDQLIAPAADPLIGGAYTFEDTGVLAGKTYFYTLEELELNGESTTHGPIIALAPRGGKVEGLACLVLLLTALAILRVPPRDKDTSKA